MQYPALLQSIDIASGNGIIKLVLKVVVLSFTELVRRHFFSYPETRTAKSHDYGKFVYVFLLSKALKNGERML